MPKLKTIRKNLESHIASAGEQQGRINFVQEVKESVGLLVRSDPDDLASELVESVDENGTRKIAKNSWRPEEYSFRDLALAIGGQKFLESFQPGEGGDAIDLLEAGPGIDPTTFLNTNLFTATVGGLVDAKMLEGFQNASLIGDQLFDTIPTNKNGEKMPGTFGFQSTDGDMTRKPGQPHARGSFGERWVTTPELVEKALACEVTQEAVFYDLTNSVLMQAGQVGEILGYGREKTMCDLFIGATNSYTYKDTAYNTYQVSAPWINTHTNVHEDWSDINAALDLFLGMTDPETGREIEVEPDTLVYYKGEAMNWHATLHGVETRKTTNTNHVMLSSPPPNSQGYNQVEFGQTWFNRIVSELSESAADARQYWFIGQPKKCFKWMEAWPMRVRQASPTEYGMLDRGLIAAFFGNYRGVGAVVEPRYIVRNIAAT